MRLRMCNRVSAQMLHSSSIFSHLDACQSSTNRSLKKSPDLRHDENDIFAWQNFDLDRVNETQQNPRISD